MDAGVQTNMNDEYVGVAIGLCIRFPQPLGAEEPLVVVFPGEMLPANNQATDSLLNSVSVDGMDGAYTYQSKVILPFGPKPDRWQETSLFPQRPPQPSSGK